MNLSCLFDHAKNHSLKKIAVLIILFGSSLHSHAESPITVVELFTSQGCYSCPPADDLLGELKASPNIIALACHVTYWNYLGWRDTFSRKFCDSRQRSYQAELKGNRGVYTPQMVINGEYGLVGSRGRQVKQVINQTNTMPMVIQIEFTDKNTLAIKLPTLSNYPSLKEQKQRLFLLGSSGVHHLPITRGENGGKKLYYHNPIEQVFELGDWDGLEKTISKSLIVNKQSGQTVSTIKEWVVIAQTWPLGKISAAGKLINP
jgi:hypothetical protein